ncbi:hypothetical protein SAMN05446935_3908 [Burkholderia sp. YR290]|nr:hypothetical protein SAMN05446935_3908 [Burkholderia sp. YR290]
MRPRFELKTLKRTLKFALNLHNAKNQRQASHNWSRAVSIRVYFSSLLGDFEFPLQYQSDGFKTIFPKRTDELESVIAALPRLKERYARTGQVI